MYDVKIVVAQRAGTSAELGHENEAIRPGQHEHEGNRNDY